MGAAWGLTATCCQCHAGPAVWPQRRALARESHGPSPLGCWYRVTACPEAPEVPLGPPPREVALPVHLCARMQLEVFALPGGGPALEHGWPWLCHRWPWLQVTSQSWLDGLGTGGPVCVHPHSSAHCGLVTAGAGAEQDRSGRSYSGEPGVAVCGQVHVVLSGSWEEPGPANPWSLIEDKEGSGRAWGGAPGVRRKGPGSTLLPRSPAAPT